MAEQGRPPGRQERRPGAPRKRVAQGRPAAPGDKQPLGRHERRALARRRRLRAVGAGTAIVLALGSVAFALLSRGDDSAVRAAPPPSTSTSTTTTLPAFQPFVTATTTGGDLVAYAEPADGAAELATLSAVTEYSQPRTLLVTDQQPGWIQALLPMRPNGSIGWVRESDVTLGSTTYEIKISLSQHHLVLTNAGEPVLETAIAVGKAATPTALGRFYVTDPVDLQSRPDGAYGAYALGISGYSEVLKTFQGGPGQLAVHGGAWESMLGTDVSNGCIRVLNDTILQIAGVVPLGTPVTIEA